MSRRVEQARHSGIEGSGGPATLTTARMPVSASDGEILSALVERRAVGGAALYDRYQGLVRRVLIRVLGMGADVDDLLQEAFITAIKRIDRVRGPESLRAWLISVAVFTARGELRSRSRRRFFHLTAHDEILDVEAPGPTPEVHAALRAAYDILGKLPADDRIAFTLRFIEGMELAEVAAACRVSLATAKRRLVRARRRFEKLALDRGELADWIGGERR